MADYAVQKRPVPPEPRRRSGKRKQKGHPFLILFVLLLILVLAGCVYVFTEIHGSFRGEGAVTVEIPQGASTSVIASRLKDSGVIGSSLVFRAYSRYTEADGAYQYGSFELDSGWSYDQIIEALQQTIEYQSTVTVTFPEGFNAYQYGDKLEEAGLCTQEEFIEALNTHSFDVDFVSEVSQDPLKMVRLEGFLFPDTYAFFADEDVDSIILRMLENFQAKVLTPERMAEIENSGFSLEELVVFASIIQREAANVEEMYNVSSVFHNRMAPGSSYPQLESCTTNNYINDYIKPLYTGDQLDAVLAAYDTYGMSGLPVGAIANPGLDAIDAALHPEKNTLDGTYYFFVTDVEYTHYYGRTYEEHLANIEKAKAVNRTHGIEGLVG